MQRINEEGLSLIKSFEGFAATPYVCSGGKLTIGYGHVITNLESFTIITEAEAVILLQKDVEVAEKAVRRLVKVDVTDNQFSALVSFTYNLGAGSFGNSTLLKKVNAGEHLDVPAEFIRWIYAGGNKLKGLLRRRLAEASLYVK